MAGLGGGWKLSAEEARYEAERWTDYLIGAYVWSAPEDRPGPVQPESRFGADDLRDIQLGIVRFGTQLRQLSHNNLRTPALAYITKDIVVPVDIAGVTQKAVPSQPDQVEQWATHAQEMLTSIADRSDFVYEELDATDAVALVRSGLIDSLVSRFMLAELFGGYTRIARFEIHVHAETPGLRVHYSSPPVPFNPIYLGAPTPTVTGYLEGGRYRFGVDGHDMEMTPDRGVFDIPETTKITLSVA